MVDYLIQNAQIIDGSGGEGYVGDLAVSRGKIAALGRLSGMEATHTIAAGGRCLTPGFIDIHRHSDGALFRPDYGKAELAQGLTTVLGGNCGLSLAPVRGPHSEEILRYLAPITGVMPQGQRFETMADYVHQAEKTPLRLHSAMLVGMGTLQACVAGFENTALGKREISALHALLERALGDGALGVSLGLGYAPECFCSTEELIQRLAPLRRSGTTLSVHLRQEGDGVVAALREMLTVARALETPVEISHLKAIGRRNWQSAVPEMLKLLRDARRDGVEVACDVYPYPAGSTQLLHVLPPEFQSGGTAALTRALRDP
ncbi:MAG: amidohydrolase family protein, partial [Oscillibacter sp.]